MPAIDSMPNVITNTGSARYAAAVTPNDTTDIGTVSRGLYVGVAGNLAVNMSGSGPIVIAVQAGFHPLSVSRVLATGTTATGIVAVW
jgi:hypothetical protein